MKLAAKKITALAAVIAAAFLGIAGWLGRTPRILPGDGSMEVSQANDVIVTKVIDGDTVIVSGGDSVRLLGIDSDEKGYPCFDAARLRLEELVLSKTVRLEPDAQDKDQYGRLLRYVFLDGKNIDEQMVAEGLAVARFYPENQKYKSGITAAEAEAIKNKIGCKWSGLSQTIASITPPAVQNLKWEKLAGDAIDACDAKLRMSEEIVIQGYVASATKSKSDTVFLNFDKPYPDNCFTAVIFKSELNKFDSPEIAFDKKTVRVKGKVIEYQGKPEIILSDPVQIEIGIQDGQ